MGWPPAAACEQGRGDRDGPQAVLDVDDRPAAVADDAQERIELGGQRLGVGDRQLGHVAGERRGVAGDQLRDYRRPPG